MSDIFSEVDEEVRRERFKKLWDRYGIVVVALAILLVVGVGGYRVYEWWMTNKAMEAGAIFEKATTLADQGKTDEALTELQRVAKEGTPGYATLARLREAGERAKTDPKAAVALFDGLAGDLQLGRSLRELASIRAAMLLTDTAAPEEMRRRLEPLAGPDGVFRHTARELLAVTAWKAKDEAGLKRWSDAIALDAETPAAVRSRVDVLNNLVAADAKS